jgi:hypothetical protein
MRGAFFDIQGWTAACRQSLGSISPDAPFRRNREFS